jgi:hypothetical protein
MGARGSEAGASRRALDFVDRGVLGVVAVLALLLGAAFPYFEQTRNANERPRLMQAVAIVEDGELAIDAPSVRGIDAGPDVSRNADTTRLYPNKPPGASLAAVVAYAGAKVVADEPVDLRRLTQWARWLGGVLPTVLLCGFLVRRLAPRFGRAPAVGAVAIYALATPACAYSHLLYGHQLAAALLGVGIPLALDACAGIDVPGRATGVRAPRELARAAVGGALAGAAVAVEYQAVFAAIPIGVALLLFARARPRVVGAAIAGALVPIALLAAYHDAAFGSPLATGYHHVTSPEFSAKHGQGLLGLGWPRGDAIVTHVLAPGGGLVWWVPLAPFAVYGLVCVARTAGPGRLEARVNLALVGVFVLVACSLSFDGGWRVGPRYMAVAFPALVLGWAEVLSQMRGHPRLAFAIAALGIYGAVVNALAGNLWPHFDLRNVAQPVAEVLLPLWRGDLRPHSALPELASVSTASLVIVLQVVVVLLAISRCVEPGVRGLVALVGGAVLGLALVQATTSMDRHPRGERNLSYIERVWEPREGRSPASVVVEPREHPRARLGP